MRLALLVAAASVLAQTPARPLWVDVTGTALGQTRYWTNKVEIADLNGDGRPDLLFANGGDYSTPGTPEPNQVFFNTGPGLKFQDVTAQVLGDTPDLARVIKARDLNDDGHVDIMVGNTYQTQSRLFLGSGQGRFTDATSTHLPAQPLSVGDLEPGDVDGDGDLDLVLADWGSGNNMSNDGGRTRLWLNDGAGRFTDATATRMPDLRVRFSWDLDLADVDNDADLDALVSCKRCPGSHLFRNDGKGRMDVVQGQGEHPKATDERVFLGRGLAPDTAAPSVSMVGTKDTAGRAVVHARRPRSQEPELGHRVEARQRRVDDAGGQARSTHAVVRREPLASRVAGERGPRDHLSRLRD